MDIMKLDKEFYEEMAQLFNSKGIILRSAEVDKGDYEVVGKDERNIIITRDMTIKVEQTI